MTTGEKIKALRLSKGLTITTLANRAGYSVKTVWAVENGLSPDRTDRICDIAQAMDVAGLDLLGDDVLPAMTRGYVLTPEGKDTFYD